jgi:hypothetical protein
MWVALPPVGVGTVFDTTLAFALVEGRVFRARLLGFGSRFDNAVWLALGVAAKSLLMPARRRDRRDLTAAFGELRTDLREQRRCEIHRLRLENEVLREAGEPLIHHAAARERFVFVHRLRARFGVRRLCRILVTGHSNNHAWVRAKARCDERGIDEQKLLAWITEIHSAHPAYGAERVTGELERHDVEVGRRRVARLMREHGIAGITRRRRPRRCRIWSVGSSPRRYLG